MCVHFIAFLFHRHFTQNLEQQTDIAILKVMPQKTLKMFNKPQCLSVVSHLSAK